MDGELKRLNVWLAELERQGSRPDSGDGWEITEKGRQARAEVQQQAADLRLLLAAWNTRSSSGENRSARDSICPTPKSATSDALDPVALELQPRVLPWMLECFGPVIPFDKEERGDRLLEETFELLQSGGYDPARVLALRDYVWGRPVGEPAQEVGGVMITLAAYCIAFGLDMHAAGETELARIWTKVEAIRAKQAAKPTGSALPIALSPDPLTPAAGRAGKAEEGE